MGQCIKSKQQAAHLRVGDLDLQFYLNSDVANSLCDYFGALSDSERSQMLNKMGEVLLLALPFKNRPSSEAEREMALSIAETLGLEISQEVLTNKAKCTEFINANLDAYYSAIRAGANVPSN